VESVGELRSWNSIRRYAVEPSRAILVRLVIWYAATLGVPAWWPATSSGDHDGSGAGSVAGSCGGLRGLKYGRLVLYLPAPGCSRVVEPLRRRFRRSRSPLGAVDAMVAIRPRARSWRAAFVPSGAAPDACVFVPKRLPLQEAVAGARPGEELREAVAAGLLELNQLALGTDAREAGWLRPQSAMPASHGHGPGQQGRRLARPDSRELPSRDGPRHFPAGRLKGIDRRRSAARSQPKDPAEQVLVLMSAPNMDCKPAYLHQFGLLGASYSRRCAGVAPRIGCSTSAESPCRAMTSRSKA